ncbi:hypothetical protein N7466_001198 [Penicillium verhagenii]|uniref:uncharacterized protein n=1 Tax=Penicillium verhagenii TaxID=1562060 RepID=UPI00254527D8|nr:uncharacterized protein N7466_001198 [Penicillium verhagenii]KAJ5948183.1 hypothetical protein N7466_001198 [Penicillium verhagenii]
MSSPNVSSPEKAYLGSHQSKFLEDLEAQYSNLNEECLVSKEPAHKKPPKPRKGSSSRAKWIALGFLCIIAVTVLALCGAGLIHDSR